MPPSNLSGVSLYYRESLTPDAELAAASSVLPVSKSMVGLKNQLVIGRYSVLPFYEDVEHGLALQNSRLVNSLAAHRYIANFEYYEDLEALTPKTYFSLASVPESGGPFVVKGRTNSRKHQWNTHMFAANKQAAVHIALLLGQDSLIGAQDILVREYTPLVTLETGINGLPFANEHRCFFYKDQLLSTGFYWSESETRGVLTPEGLALAQAAAKLLAPKVNFFAIDVAEKAAGGWTVIEVNDGQMSGLSQNDPNILYPQLAQTVRSLEFPPRLGPKL